MANRNDYNYYKNEYGKYKDNYYSPGSEAYKKRKISSTKQKAGKIFRAIIVFILIAAIVVGIVFGIIKLTGLIRNKASNEEPTTITHILEGESTSAKNEESTTAPNTVADVKVGSECKIKTNDGNGVYLRSGPANDAKAFSLIADGETFIVAEISEDGSWCKSSNFSINGWVNVKFLLPVSEEIKPQETTTKPPEETTKKPEPTREPTTQLDGDIKSYADAVKAFKAKGNGAVMNCKIVSKSTIYATATTDPSSARLLYLESGYSVKVIKVDGGYSQVTVQGFENAPAWVPNENLTFVSWG